MDVDVLIELYVGDLDGMIEQGDAPVAIDYPSFSQAEDILRGCVRRR